MRILGRLVQHIAIGDLGAEEDGSDETDNRDGGKDDDMLVTRPRERIFLTGVLQIGVKGDRSQNEKEGDEHRAEKCVNHFNKVLKVTKMAGPSR